MRAQVVVCCARIEALDPPGEQQASTSTCGLDSPDRVEQIVWAYQQRTEQENESDDEAESKHRSPSSAGRTGDDDGITRLGVRNGRPIGAVPTTGAVRSAGELRISRKSVWCLHGHCTNGDP